MSYIDKINRDGTDYDIQDSYAARSVEGSTASHVLQANEIYTETVQTQFAEFIFRTTGGDASLETGDAILEAIYGGCYQETPSVPESLTTSSEFTDSDTTVALNKSTWRSQVANSGNYSFTYDGTNWQLNSSNVNLASYGLTVTGTVSDGDSITVSYTKMIPHPVTVATPTTFVSTGFNQYDATAGYAHVVGGNQYRIDGTYTSLTFSTTPTGTTSAVTVTDNRFVPSDDGYIHVVGGSGDILIALVWSGIMDNRPYEAFETSTITIPTKDADNNNLPTATYGMPGIGNIRDSISFTEKVYTKRIERIAYSEANYDAVAASGAPFLFDSNYIYYPLASAIIYPLADSTSPIYTANDFGTEEFVGTTVPIYAGLRYGNSLVDKLRNLVDIQDVGEGLTMDGSTIKTAYELGDNIPTGFTSSDGAVSAEGSSITLSNTIYAPAEVNFFAGSSVQTQFSGKNMLDTNTMEWGYIRSSDGTIVTKTVNGVNIASDYIPVSPNTKYTGSLYAFPNCNKRISFGFYDANRAYISLDSMGSGSTSTRTTTTPTNCAYIRVGYYKSTSWSDQEVLDAHFQLESGETATAYEAFVLTPSPTSPQSISSVTGAQHILSRGKNFFDAYGDFTFGTTNFKTYSNGDGTVTATANFGSARSAGQELKNLKPNTTYSVTATIIDARGNHTSGLGAVQILRYDSSSSTNEVVRTITVSRNSGGGVPKTVTNTFTTGEDATNYWISINGYTSSSAVPANAVYKNVQVEEGEVVTSYERTRGCTIDLGATALYGLGGYSDKIFKIGNDWYLHREIGVVQMDGSSDEDWHTANLCYYITLSNKTQNTLGYCDYFKNTASGFSATDERYRGYFTNNKSATGVYMMPTDTTQTTLELFKTWLAQTTPTVYYIMNSFTDTKITDTTMIKNLSALWDMNSYANNTYITVTPTGASLPAKVNVTASVKNLNGVLTAGLRTNTEDLSFTLMDGSTVTKRVVIK